MPKTYFNDAIIGNSSMLGCITGEGQLVRLYWPNIDYPQHIDRFSCGIFDEYRNTSWFDSDDWEKRQRYLTDTNILETSFSKRDGSLSVRQTDFVLPDKDILIRGYEIANTGPAAIEAGFMVYSSAITTNPQLACILFDFKNDSLVHYKHNYYISVSCDLEVWQYQLGNDAFGAAERRQLKGNDQIGMMHDGAISFKLGRLDPGMKKTLKLYICAAHTLKDVKAGIKEAKALDYGQALERTSSYWKDILKAANDLTTGIAVVDQLYRRSILVFKLMSDKKTGGLLASPEIDEEFTRCGRYAYCWGRDAAFITGAMDACGLHSDVEKFYRWAANVQDEDGSWQQRYHLDGNLAPSWGLQVDETGTILWGILRHYKATGDRDFLRDMWECASRGAEFLLNFTDPDTGLPWLSFDLWEERLGEHAYSTASVYGGLMNAAEIADILKKPAKQADIWRAAAGRMKEALVKYFYKPEWDRFIRSIRVKLNPWGEEHSPDRVVLKIDSKGNERDFTAEDWRVDISLLGLTIPFGVFDADDPKMEGTLRVVEQVLASPLPGGLKRYEYDDYAGGNPWLIASLWAALYHIEKKNYDKAEDYFSWAVSCRTELGLLPEQAHRDTGKPAWIIPLTWSHAMFVLVLEGLIGAGVFRQGDGSSV